MTNWNQRMLPYPLLAPWCEDYEDADFGIDITDKPMLISNSEIRLEFRVKNSSPALAILVKKARAKYIVLVSCADTFMSETFTVEQEGVLRLDAGEYAEEIVLRPYLIADEAIDEFSASERAEEWKLHRPEGFSVPRAGIMAVGDGQKISLGSDDPESVIDLVVNPSIADESFQIDLGDERIKIYVSESAKERVEIIRRNRASNPGFKALFPALYLHAISEALRQITEHADSRWARAMRRALDSAGYGDVDDELIEADSLKYAQALMNKPLGEFLNAMVNADDKQE